jgi:transcriptional regulator with XRE-family HTH domain
MRKERKQMRLTLREFYSSYNNLFEAADELGISHNQLQLLLSGKALPSFPTCRKLMKRGISLENFPD